MGQFFLFMSQFDSAGVDVVGFGGRFSTTKRRCHHIWSWIFRRALMSEGAQSSVQKHQKHQKPANAQHTVEK
jgi:hypothetical protein